MPFFFKSLIVSNNLLISDSYSAEVGSSIISILAFNDIAFATSDIFMRADQSVGRIEAIRGGSASTLASNSPAGIINFPNSISASMGYQDEFFNFNLVKDTT